MYFIIISIAGFLWLYINREQYAYITQYLAVLGISFILCFLMHAVFSPCIKEKIEIDYTIKKSMKGTK